jgi:hypothetical protein
VKPSDNEFELRPEYEVAPHHSNQRTNGEVPEVIYLHRPDAEHYSRQYEGLTINASASAGSNPSIEIWDHICDTCNRQVCSTPSDDWPISDTETVLSP